MAQLSAHQRKVLLSNAWLAAVDEAVVDDVVAGGSMHELQCGTCLFRRGDAYDGVYVVLEGSVRTSGMTREGREVILTLHAPGAWFGEISAFDGLPRTHDLYAHTHSLLLRLRPTEFEDLLQRHPALSSVFLRLECARLRLALAALEDFSTQGFEQRLAARLLDLAGAFGTTVSTGVRIELHLPQEVLASMVGSTRQRVNQVLIRWERAGLTARDRSRLKLVDLEVLRQLAAG